MSKYCNAVVFSDKAYNAIIRETFEKHPVETGGILLGHIINGIWVVMEVLPPGINSIFQTAYFEYDEKFVNYLAQSVANQYKQPLSLLGLWHRHPGSMDVFSGTDDQTNSKFARQLSQGVISGLVNVDPKFRFTMYYLHKDNIVANSRPGYEKIDVEVGDDIIPPNLFELRYVTTGDKNIHPMPHTNDTESFHINTQHQSDFEVKGDTKENGGFFSILQNYWKEMLIFLLVCALILVSALALLFRNEPSVHINRNDVKEKVDNNGANINPTISTPETPKEKVSDEIDNDNVEQEKTEQDGKQGSNNK